MEAISQHPRFGRPLTSHLITVCGVAKSNLIERKPVFDPENPWLD
jgi:hypothetical protein